MSEPVVDLGRSAALRPLLLAGAAVAVAFFGGLGGWAATAPLVGAVVAPAVVAPVGQRKSIQHLEGGIVREILVREGESVAAAQPLVSARRHPGPRRAPGAAGSLARAPGGNGPPGGREPRPGCRRVRRGPVGGA